MKNKKNKILFSLGILFLLLIIGLGIGIYFGFIKNKDKTNDELLKPSSQLNYLPDNKINNKGNKTGFITNNWGLIANNEFNSFGKYKINIDKAISDI